jgi:hypothetical protein
MRGGCSRTGRSDIGSSSGFSGTVSVEIRRRSLCLFSGFVWGGISYSGAWVPVWVRDGFWLDLTSMNIHEINAAAEINMPVNKIACSASEAPGFFRLRETAFRFLTPVLRGGFTGF